MAGEEASPGMPDSGLRVFSDAPTEKDELGRARYVEALADVTATAATPLVVAIYGAWGSGKTSLMRQVRRRIDADFDVPGAQDAGDTGPRTVWFDPWMHQFDQSPAVGLLHATTDQLGLNANPAVREALGKIAMALAEEIRIPYIGLRVGRIVKIREELAEDELRRREMQAQLRAEFHRVLRAAGAPARRLVFFIDDLDRCRPVQTLEVLEALKLYLDLEGCVYVLGVDRAPLEAAVGTEYKQLGLSETSYLDKIIQLPFSLPAIDDSAMRDFVSSRVPDELSDCTEMLVTAGADDPRQVKRILNSLLLNTQLIPRGLDVDQRLLAALVLIQNLAPEMYRIARLDPTRLHELWRPDSPVWEEHIAPQPRLAAALRLVTLPANLDPRPYFSLTEAVAPPKPADEPNEPVKQAATVIDLGGTDGTTELAEDVLESLMLSARAALADASRRARPGSRDTERLTLLLADLAPVGGRIFDELQTFGSSTFQGPVNAPRVVSVQLAPAGRVWLPAALVYDQPIDRTRWAAAFTLCPSFRDAWLTDRPLAESTCWTGKCPSADDATALCPSGFWGFRHAIAHVPPSGLDGPAVTVRYEGEPEIVSAVGTELRGAQEHQERLIPALPEAKWELTMDRDRLVTLLARGSAQLIYLYFHGDVEEDVPSLIVGRERLSPGSIPEAPGRDAGPLVLLNSDLGAPGFGEFSMSFLRGGASSVTGPEVAIPPTLAEAFAERFLRRLLAEETVEWALRNTRLDVLQSQGDPLSLAYTALTSPGTRLERAGAGS